MSRSTASLFIRPAFRRAPAGLPRRPGPALAVGAALLAMGGAILGCGGDIESRMAEVRALQDVGQFTASIDELREILAANPDLDAFVIEGEPEKRRGVRTPQGDIKVDFGLRRQDGLETVLVDFEEGSASTEYGADRVREDYAAEVLLFTPEGKLLARNSVTDARDEERTARLKYYRDRLENVKKNQSPAPAGGTPPGGGIFGGG